MQKNIVNGKVTFHSEQNPSYTKKGPGRKHKQGGEPLARRQWNYMRRIGWSLK